MQSSLKFTAGLGDIDKIISNDLKNKNNNVTIEDHNKLRTNHLQL